jgi:hypothetical protein
MNRLANACACGLLMFAGGCAASGTLPPSDVMELLKKCPLVFDATPERMGVPAFLKGEGVDLEKMLGRTEFMLVRVNRVHHDATNRLLKAGSEVWIAQLPSSDPAQIKHATWYAQLWMTGDQLVVREVGHETTLRPTAAIEKFEAAIQLDAYAERLRQAQEIVTGVVVKVAPPATKPGRTSEHDPEWRIAEFLVRERLKGESKDRQIQVKFALSKDVAWYRAPKLEEKETAILLLRRSDVTAPYVLIDPEDRRSITERDRIEAVLKR